MTDTTHEAVILGGGLAGLCLALQLRKRFPDMDILVLERHRHPLPSAAHKVGESTVEIGSDYFDTVLGLREHLDAAQLHKFGLRYFFSDGRDDIQNTTELGVSHILPTPSYHLDRGIFETFLGEQARRRGIDFRDGSAIKSFDLGQRGAAHSVRFTDDAGEHQVSTRWLLDASGRAALIRRRLELTVDNGHRGNAVWFRMDARIDVDGWADDDAWHARCSPRERWRSANHFMGPGYWAWLIPLPSGAHSVGIVSDPSMHSLDAMRDFDKALGWLQTRQPALGRAVAAERDKLMDFRFLRNYSHGSSQVFSADRWALTGEAGCFPDPFYSPGSDFIGIANTYIVDLVAQDRAGRGIAPYAHFYEKLYLSFYENTLSMFRGQYPLFGNVKVFPAKMTWDYAYYWGVLCQLVFQRRLTDLGLLSEMRPELERAQALNARMQLLLRHWHETGSARASQREMFDQCALPWFAELNSRLHDPLDDAGVRARLRENVRLLEGVADSITVMAGRTDARLHAPLSGHPQPVLFDTTDAARELSSVS